MAEYREKERWKIESKVFDRNSLLILNKLMGKGIIKEMEYPISTGKEAHVFLAKGATGNIAVKIYKIETGIFVRKEKYIAGDPRFKKIKKSEREYVYAFARKEYKNLEICERAGVNAPIPIYQIKNIVVMEFLGKREKAYPRLIECIPEKKDMEKIIENTRKMYKKGLVHGDLSPYNILKGDKIYLLDLGQGVVLEHPHAKDFLKRDLKNLVRYFKKNGIEYEFEEVWKRVTE